MLKSKIIKTSLFFIMTLICLNLTVEHWHNFENYDLENNGYYEKFDQYLNKNIDIYTSSEGNFKRTFEGAGGNTLLEERGKTRWIFKSLKSEIMILTKNLSEKQNLYPSKKAALYIYSIFIGSIFLLIFFFLYLLLIEIGLKYNSKKDEFDIYNHQLIYLFFSYFLTIGYLNFIHFRGGEDWFSIFETLFLLIGFYTVIKNNKISLLIYIIVCLLAPMVRESGIIISGIYICYHFIILKKVRILGIFIPLLSLIPYLLSNYELLQYYLVDGFILTTQSLPHQTTWHDLGSNFIGTMNAIFYNFIIFLVPLIVFFKKNDKLQMFFLLFIIIYFMLLAFASVLDHLSTRFMPTSLIILYVYIGLINKK